MRHPYQVGPTRARVTTEPRHYAPGWYAHEEWFEHTHNGDDEHEEEWHGPFATREAAEACARGIEG